ncbi:hypothetical protein FRC04_005243 [Tulasnella sp. 424]|nr:hypothetical protein FRC04_005243 [Tulasnella sp. 424]
MTLEAAVPPTICVILNIGFYIGMDIEKAAVVLAVMPDPIRSSININQELVGHHAAARNARSSRGDPDDELV